jgi:hypothetical protein
LACQCSISLCSFSSKSSCRRYFIPKKLCCFSIHKSCTTLIMYLETINCSAFCRSAYFVNVTTFFDIEPSTFNFDIHIVG